MSTVNPWKKFESLLPKQARIVVTITTNNGDGTSTATLRTGETIKVNGESVAAGSKAFVVDDNVQGQATSLPLISVNV